jgi:hypothetical protein
MVAYNNNNNTGGYKGTGVQTDTAESAIGMGRAVAGFVPGTPGKVADLALAGLQGDVEGEKEEQRLKDTGLNINKHEGKFNPSVKTHLEKLRGRWRGRLGEAGVSLGGVAAGGTAGVALAGALGVAGGFVIPVVGAPIGAAAGSLIGGAIGGGVASKAYNTAFPMDDKDEVDLMIKIVEAQKQGQAIPPEAIFAQWAAQQKGSMDIQLKKDLYSRTGLTNFNDAVEQGKMAELNAMMKKDEYEIPMRAYMGVSPDYENPDKRVSEQVAEWVNTGMLQGKDLLLGSAHIPNMSLADAQREGYLSDDLAAPTLQMGLDNRSQKEPSYSMSV